MNVILKIFNDPRLIISVGSTYVKWALSGFKTRSPKEVQEIFDICWECPHVNRLTGANSDPGANDAQKNKGTIDPQDSKTAECSLCGCYLRRKKNLFKLNKIQLNTSCPDDPPRW